MREGKIGIGVIGCGAVARGFHLPALRRNPDAALLALADVDGVALDRAAREFRVERATLDYREWIEDPAIEAVIIATPPEVTPEIAIACLRAGKHVLCEKPIAISREMGLRVVEVAETSGRKFQVGFIFRFNAGVQMLKRWIAEGALGSPMVVRLGAFNEPWMVTDPDHNRRIIDALPTSTPLVAGGAHFADMALYFISAPPIHVGGVSARTQSELPEDNHWIGVIEFADGSICKLEMAWLHPIAQADEHRGPYPQVKYPEIEIFGPRGIAWHDLRTGRTQLVRSEGVIRKRLPPYELNFDRQLEAFLTAIREDRPPSPDARDGYRSLILTLDLQEAIRRHTILEIAQEEYK
ncbi:MAG: Gfo/Idh/MocA family oxidoreductase [Blastocatellia bacterium]|nr:Gfo/Idh/MocA family oxidoreductase [Blastocatellia bacterium]MCS7158589.1 Gfo/Idh/MocA family oxidoreductase [Blastocatellia bacterium]MDW8169285.1 Gfo/Idh/MocA family oxidoreductase [Acidobacteriota bacterium]MDW8257785.1 Gfo/Idh/MocA family oxidoreductase [Acidobacteriota bacterium]